MMVTAIGNLQGAIVKRLYEEYRKAFAEVARNSVQRHMLWEDEFHGICANPHIQKYLVFNGEGKAVGMGAYTNNHLHHPLISGDYFAHHFNELHMANRIWYCIFVFVTPEYHASSAFYSLVKAMYETAADTDSMIVIDYSRFNSMSGFKDAYTRGYPLARTVATMLSRLSGGVQARILDEQSYWAYTFNDGEEA